MKRIALIFVFITLCFSLLVIKGGAYAQQGTIPVDLSKIFDPLLLLRFPPNPTFPPVYYQTGPWLTSQLATMMFPTIQTMNNYYFLSGNSWYLWQIYGFPPSRISPAPKKDTSTSSIGSKLKLSIKTDKKIYDMAELVKITLTLKNNGSEEAIIAFPSEQKFDVIVKDKAGQVVRQLSSDIQYAQPSTSLTLQPGDTETVYVQWDQEDAEDMIVLSGSYTVNAALIAADEQYNKTVYATISIESLPRFSNCKELKGKLAKFVEDLNEGGNGGGEDNGETPTELYPPGKVSSPAITGYLYGGAFGALYGIGGFGPAFPADITRTFAMFTPSYSVPAFSTPVFTGAFGFYAPSFGSAYSNLSAGLSTSYSSYGGVYNAGSIRWKRASEGPSGDEGGSEHGHSVTNVQVVGVDEADIIKNDGAYIYMIKGKTVQIIKGSPPKDMKVLNEISLEQYTDFDLKRLFVNGNVLVVIGEQPLPADEYPEIPPQGTRIFIYDITDKEHESLARKLIFWGAYVQSRRVEETLYVVINEAAPLKLLEEGLTDLRALLPHFYDSCLHGDDENNNEIICDCDEVKYLPEYLTPDYLVVMGIPLDDHTKEIGREIILGKSNHVYATAENLYMTSEHQDVNITVIYKFWFEDETIVYGSNTQVPGKIINQFSMDEHEDHLRIATTSDSGPQSENNIYIFDSGMKMTGKLEDFTSGGSIYSIRFLDDRCYVVISREILPLSVISLADPTDPASLGVLDIFDGISYLHPFDENRILGFGREIVEGSKMGMKISFFDIANVSNPQRIREDEIIGSLNTESEVLKNHRALLLNQEKNLMAFPVTVAEEDGFLPYISQGAYVYQINENGFEIMSEITHYPEGTFPTNVYDDSSQDHIKRIIYMGDYYYAISENRITARDMLTHFETFSVHLE